MYNDLTSGVSYMEKTLLSCWLVEINLRGVSETLFTHDNVLGSKVGKLWRCKEINWGTERVSRSQTRSDEIGGWHYGYNVDRRGVHLLSHPAPLQCPFRGDRQQEPNLDGSAALCTYKELDKLGDS